VKIALLILALWAALAVADPGPPPILPKTFGGWQVAGNLRSATDPAAADPANASLLKEYGFTGFEQATYIHEGRKLTIQAARFADASGAYGAFTFYKQPEMLKEEIGDQGSSRNQRVLFYRGNVLVDAVFEKLTAMSAADLRTLAGLLPMPGGSARSLPSLPTYLPRQSYVKNSAKYVVGPVGLQKIEAPLNPELVNFSAGAEVILGRYYTSEGGATLVLINYPTPQIATERMQAMAAWQKAQSGIPPLFTKRSGPLLAVVTGSIGASEAKSLLASVNYDADVTWNESTSFNKKDNLANLLVNVILLCGIVIAFALVTGMAFGGLRVLVKRCFPNRIFGNFDNTEIISLHLGASSQNPARSDVTSSIKAS
jgi:hypothetical protein